MPKIIDLRTYLLLERAFIRRLQRSWQQQSAPIYAAITKACTDHEWDKARRLVTDLDMTEVGTENREWITYMLLSFAVFGASTVKKGKPSFVGAGSTDTFLKQVTNNFLQYLEHGATAQIQAEALQLIAEDEAKTKAVKFDYDQLRGPNGRWVKEPVSPDTPTSTAKTAIGLIHNGVVRVHDLKQRDPYEVGHEDYWRTEVPASSRFRYNKGNIEWLDKPNADEYFAVDDYFANEGWLIRGHYGQTHGDFIPPPEPSLKREYVRDEKGQFAETDGLGDLSTSELSSETVQKLKDRLVQGIAVYRGVRQEGRSPADPGDFGVGSYHSSSAARARQYGALTQTMLQLHNPLILTATEAYDKLTHLHDTVTAPMAQRQENAALLTKKLQARGYDGLVIINNKRFGEIEYVQFPENKP